MFTAHWVSVLSFGLLAFISLTVSGRDEGNPAHWLALAHLLYTTSLAYSL